MQALLLNLRYCFRSWRESRALISIVLLTIAFGIGANTAIFTVVYATLLAPGPYPHPDQLVNVWTEIKGQRNSVSVADFDYYRRQSRVFQELNAYNTDNFNIATKDRPEFLDGMQATPGFLSMLGNSLALGRDFLPAEAEAGNANVVILTNTLWRHLGADHKIVGQKMQINGEPHRVVGVMAAGPGDRSEWELMVPLVFTSEQLRDHVSRYWSVTGRLKPGVTIEQARAEMKLIAAKESTTYPKSNEGVGVMVSPFKHDLLPNERLSTLWLLLGAVGLLLLIACLNVANLLLAKSMTRHREVAIRVALGANPSSIFLQFLTESLSLSILGGLLGIGAGVAMLQGLLAAIPKYALPAEADLRLNFPILFIMLTVAALTGVLFGSGPALYASRLDPAGALKDGSRASTGHVMKLLRRSLVISEFALALPLLTGAGLVLHSFWNLTHLDLGVRTDHILGCYLDSVSLERDPSRANINAYYRRILSSIRAVPGVSRVCAMSFLPLDRLHTQTPFGIKGRPDYTNPSQRPNADIQTFTPACVDTFGLRIERGRGFTENDSESSVKVVMVNEAFANQFLRGTDPLQQHVVLDQSAFSNPGSSSAIPRQVVGVLHTIKSRSGREDHPEIYVPFWQEGFSISALGVQTTRDPASMIKSIARAVNSIDSGAALALTRTMTQVHDEALANDRFTLVVFAGFAVVALFLSAVGVYAVMAFSVAQRSREMALRMALGASRSGVITLVVKEGLCLAGIGLALGLTGAWFVGRVMKGIIFGVGPVDGTSLGAVMLLLLSAAFLASYRPALRAASVETMQTLRLE